jgi:hypothetical protein
MTVAVLTVGLAAGCGSVKPVNNWDGYAGNNNNLDGSIYVPPDVDYSSTGSISGTVWLPGNGPGQVPTDHEIPVFDALIYLASDKPAAMPREVYCEQCVDPPSRYVTTDHQGQFVMTNVFAGTYWIVIQKGHFRLSQQITISEREDLELTATQTTLPSVQDYDNGKEIPNIALASGSYDAMEDILGKMGIGAVDTSGAFNGPSAAGNFAVYSNGGSIDNVAVASLASLVEDYNTLRQYHILFIPCSYQTYQSGSGLSGAPPIVLQNIRQFVSDGGKLYVTDWSGEYVDNVFPEQIRFASDHDTPASAWSGTAWNTALFSDSDGWPSYTSEHALALDPDIAQWLHGQYGPIVNNGTYSVGTYDASAFEVEGNWDHIEETVAVQLGLDNEGFPIIDTPRNFIIGDEYGNPSTCIGNTGCKPLTVTFEPVGCGRVLYSTYHTTESTHTGLVPQERVLAYLIMEIGVCKSGPIVR